LLRIGSGTVSLGGANGAHGLEVTTPASTVNRPEVMGGATGMPGRTGWRAAGSDANISAVMQPKGTGALLAQFPDNAATGGNARGANAVDFQTARSAATQVASGVGSTIAGGSSSTASGGGSTVGGGFNNSVSGTNATVSGGHTNGASGLESTVSGGRQNAASASRSTVSGGFTNAASGTSSIVAGGSTNTASGVQSGVLGGVSNVASGINSWVPGGAFATTRGIISRGAWAATRIAATGDAQCGEHPLLRQTTDAIATRLTSDNAAPSAVNQVGLPDFSSYSGVLTVTAKAAGSTAAAVWRLNVSAVRGSGAATVVVYEGAGTAIVPTASNGLGSAWRLDVAADTTNGGIGVTATGAAATTINWSARYANVEAVSAS
jgi:hypothetical protein